MEDSESAVNSATAGSGYATADVPTERGDLATSTDMINGVNIGACGHSLGDEISDLNSTQEEATNARTHDTSENFSSSAPVSMDTTQVAAYDSSLNVVDACETGKIVSAGIIENGITSDVHDLVPEDKLVEVSALSAEEERLWKIVRANSLDFNAWTALIEETEKAAEISKIRKVYDAFLAEFPLCYGYWKKYADHEERLGFIDKVVEVYERAVQGVTYSVDMWVHYSVFAINTYGDPDTNRRLFERGLAYVGSDYLSFPLWDKYIEYEYKQQEWSRLAVIYTRILENPNQQLDQYFTSFRELVAHRPLTELRTAEEAAAAAAASVPPADSGQQTEGELHPNVAEQCPKPLSVAGLTEAEELEKYIAIREEMYNKSKELDSKIIGFENSIRRPYFHVPPLSGGELENWHNYLDFIEAEAGDNLNKVVKLYERCLIACANYPEFWIRYVLCMEGRGSMHLAENALARATQVFVKRQPEIHLFAALFRECSGDIPGARAAYQLVHSEISPGLLEAIIKHASMECRLGNVEDACLLYEQTIAIEKGKEHSQTLPLLYAQYSRFVYLACSKVEKSREILDEALENCQLSKPLLEAIIHLESIKSLPKRIDYLDSLVSKFTVLNQGTGSIMDREELSSIFLQFVNLFGDTQSIKKALYRHAKLFLRHKRTPDSKKRHAEDFLVSEKSKLAKSGGVLASSPSVTSTYQSTQNQWAAAGYGVQPQAWPQVAQAQAQNWNTAHPQQATYGAYGSTYAQPQVPTSVPQAAAYGAYAPPMYPVQAYPQQSYAQAGTLATLTSAQQPAAVAPPAYYDSYY